MAEKREPIDLRTKVKKERDYKMLEEKLREIALLKETKKKAEEDLKAKVEEMVPLLQSFDLGHDIISLDGKVHFVMYGNNVTTSQDRLRTALLKYKVPIANAKKIMEESKAEKPYTTIQTITQGEDA